MGAGASTAAASQKHLDEITRLRQQNEMLKRQTVLQEKKDCKEAQITPTTNNLYEILK